MSDEDRRLKFTGECKSPVLGPFGSVVGLCDLPAGHESACRTDGVSEGDMLDFAGLGQRTKRARKK